MNAITQIIQTYIENHYHHYITNFEVWEIELQCHKCTLNVINEHVKQPREDNDYAVLHNSKSGKFYDMTTHESYEAEWPSLPS